MKAAVAGEPCEEALSRQVHLNPVRIGRLGLGKKERQRQRHGMGGRPEARLVALGRAAGEMDDAAVGAAVQRLTRRLKTDQTLSIKARQAESKSLNVET